MKSDMSSTSSSTTESSSTGVSARTIAAGFVVLTLLVLVSTTGEPSSARTTATGFITLPLRGLGFATSSSSSSCSPSKSSTTSPTSTSSPSACSTAAFPVLRSILISSLPSSILSMLPSILSMLPSILSILPPIPFTLSLMLSNCPSMSATIAPARGSSAFFWFSSTVLPIFLAFLCVASSFADSTTPTATPPEAEADTSPDEAAFRLPFRSFSLPTSFPSGRKRGLSDTPFNTLLLGLPFFITSVSFAPSFIVFLPSPIVLSSLALKIVPSSGSSSSLSSITIARRAMVLSRCNNSLAARLLLCPAVYKYRLSVSYECR
ncbi:hypothetical protein VC83_04655 [Pseudogymnoascus destructans]|uniref:Uncharacterized protein n=1 Tax=Pseudogymnoascus destructans TaxID=655981 RepID=A0A177A8I1_9PEZI|nr:uncharacterized protein VC83_04655 [Pseudogymnoascus destructans]OAF57433.1 hypothetical protein VC83_04655 [Pseudogymnoascus destructans]